MRLVTFILKSFELEDTEWSRSDWLQFSNQNGLQQRFKA